MPSYFNAVCDTIFDTNQFVIENGVFVLSRRDSMIELKNIHINLSQNGRQIIEDFSFTLNRGEKAVIIGEEGNGKSTLLKYIYDEKLIDSYCEYSGTVIKKGRLAYLPQEIDERYLDVSLHEYFSKEDTLAHINIISNLDLPFELIESERKIRTLSGGEKVKIQLVKIMMEDPDILLLDEPTNDLDIETLEWLERFICNTKLPVLFVSHDETLIENTANVIIHLEQLHRKSKPRITVAHASYKEYLSLRRQVFSKQAQLAKKQRDDYEKQMERWQQIYNRVDHEQRVITRQDPGGARLLKKKMKSVLAQRKRFEREAKDFLDFPEEEEAILTKFNDDITIPNGKVILDFFLPELQIDEKILSRNIRLFVSGSEHIGIIGKNGAGKSTLLAVLWEKLKERRDIIPYFMPQDYAKKLDYSKTPVQYLADNYTKEDITRARTYMGCMRFTHEEMTGKIGSLSGGQKAKILFLDMVLRNANVLLLDEPTRNFSPLSGPVVRKALKNFGGAIISVSHDRKYLGEVCDKVYLLTESGLEVCHETGGTYGSC